MGTAASRQEPLAVRLYSSLLFAYPADFRREYAREMKLAFQDRWAEECGHNVARLWLQTLADVAWSAAREHLDQLVGDLRHASRTLRNEPSYAVVSTTVLALGIACSTIAFTVLNGTLLRPLPYPEADRLVAIDVTMQGQNSRLSWPEFAELNAGAGLISDIGGCAIASLMFMGDPSPEEVDGTEVTRGMLSLLRVSPVLGRFFTKQEHQPGGDAVILLSHALWQRRYGGDPTIVGKLIRTGSRPLMVVGVMPPQFGFPSGSQFWVPAVLDKWSNVKPTTLFIEGYGRLHASTSVEQARSGIVTIMKRTDAKHDSTSWEKRIDVKPLRAQLTTPIRSAVLAAMGAVGLVLLISCANISNLLLARASTRRRELSLRAALGASRSHIVRQIFIESAVLATLGGLAGLVLVLTIKPAILAIITARAPFWVNFDWDRRILAFVGCVSLLTTLLVGIVPAMRISDMNAIGAFREGGKGGSASRGTRRILSVLVFGQISMSVLLLLNAGLLIRSFLNLLRVDVGFDHRSVLTFRGSFPSTVAPSGIDAIRKAALAEIAGLPGVSSAAMTSHVPLSRMNKLRALTVEGRPVMKLRDTPTVNNIWASPGFFRTLDIPMVNGRDFAWSDRSAHIAIVDADLAKQYWPGQSAIGRRIRLGPPENNEPWHTVVGVVRSARMNSLTLAERSTVYLPITHVQWNSAFFVVKSATAPSSLTSTIRQRLDSVAGDTAVDQLQTMESVKNNVVWQPRFFTTLFGVFAVIALIVTAVGVYGIISYSVNQRTHDFAVRVALGASAAGLVALILRSALALTGLGVAAGVVGAIATGSLIETQLVGLESTDTITFAIVCGVVITTAALTSLLPALRASRADPIVALKQE